MNFLKDKVIDWYNLTLEDRFDKMYSVQIEIDSGEYAYISSKNPFSLSDNPMLFLNEEEAQEEANNWYTGVVHEWYIDRKKGISTEIRPMTKEERQRSKEKEQQNDSSSEQQQ